MTITGPGTASPSQNNRFLRAQKTALASIDEVVDELHPSTHLAIPIHSTFIVDGLDECSATEAQREALAAFKKLITRSSTRVFIASRENIDVTRMIQGSVCLSEKSSPKNTTEDLELFI